MAWSAFTRFVGGEGVGGSSRQARAVSLGLSWHAKKSKLVQQTTKPQTTGAPWRHVILLLAVLVLEHPSKESKFCPAMCTSCHRWWSAVIKEINRLVC